MPHQKVPKFDASLSFEIKKVAKQSLSSGTEFVLAVLHTGNLRDHTRPTVQCLNRLTGHIFIMCVDNKQTVWILSCSHIFFFLLSAFLCLYIVIAQAKTAALHPS